MFRDILKRLRSFSAPSPRAKRPENSLGNWTPPPRQVNQTADKPATFVIYRILGNDLYPRHEKGQTRKNLAFILENEPPLANCEKRWVVNRIFDEAEAATIIALLEKYQQPYLTIPFEVSAYARMGMDHESFPDHRFWFGSEPQRLPEKARIHATLQTYRFKNLYAMNNNGARNAALRDGLNRARWILPWDGNCFLTESAWHRICNAVEERPDLPYFIVPMARIQNNAALLNPGFEPEPGEEPQIIFRNDARENFNEAHPYGRRPKVELFWRLGVPGAWDRWKDHPWDLPRSPRSMEAGYFGVAGWVARLNSGRSHLEKPEKSSFQDRGLARAEAIQATLNVIDISILKRSFSSEALLCYDPEALEESRHALKESRGPLLETVQTLIKNAEAALDRGPYSVTHKPKECPSGDVHDYWHPAPYWWPNPETKTGYPYVFRDGERVPGTVLYEPASDQYDRTRLQRLFDDSTVLALASEITAEPRYAHHAAILLKTWFVDPETRMNPHLRFSQSRSKTPKSEGANTGIIETKDFYFFLDAVRILKRLGAIDSETDAAFKGWLTEFRGWLRNSPQGLREVTRPNNHGVLFDLQEAAISAYLEDIPSLAAILRRARGRIAHHFDPDGAQPHELNRTLTAHYCTFNLQAWFHLATLAARCGDRLADVHTDAGRSIKTASGWLLEAIHQGTWNATQIAPFDWARLYPLATCADAFFGTQWLSKLRLNQPPKAVLHPHDGVPPFWLLTFPPCSLEQT